MNEYLFFRHAEPENQAPGFSGPVMRDSAGRADHPLSRRGREQAEHAAQVAKDFGAEMLISSSLLRARETADIMARTLSLSPHRDPELGEVNPGRSSLRSLSFSNRRITTVSLALVTAYLFDRRVSARRTGEAAPDLLARIDRVLDRLLRHDTTRIAIVGHGYWIFTAAMLITPGAVRSLSAARTIKHAAHTRIERSADGTMRVLELGRSG